MIDADRVVIGHASVSYKLGRILHDKINMCILGERLRESCTLYCESEACVESYVFSF